MNILSEKSYYAIFCDIILKENNGISIAKQIKEKYPKTPIIFISNHNDLIFETQYIQPLCFIRKSKLKEDFNLFKTLIAEKFKSDGDIQLLINNKKRKINTSDIIYVESNNHDLLIHTFTEKIKIRMSMKEFIENIKYYSFFVNVHKSFLVNMNYIYSFNANSITMQNKHNIPISRSKKKNFESLYNKFILS